jgi:hypothetical protein
MQREISLSLGGEAGARLAKSLGLPISGDSLLRRLASIERLPSGELRVIGVDDWALRRGQTYGTLICDLERRRPVAMLKTRSAEALIEGSVRQVAHIGFPALSFGVLSFRGHGP